MCLFNAQLQLFREELRSKWDGPFTVTQVFPHGTVEIQNPTNENTFKVNEQRQKHFVKNIVRWSND